MCLKLEEMQEDCDPRGRKLAEGNEKGESLGEIRRVGRY